MSSYFQTLQEWAGAQHLNLTLLFTDIVDSTKIGRKLGDRQWIEKLFLHFDRGYKLAWNYDCYVVKSIGDSFMVAFRTSTDAVLFALDFSTDTGVEYISIRAGINSGQVQIRENDIYGLNVNFTSRVQHAIENEGILMSHSVQRDYVKAFGEHIRGVRFIKREVDLKSFGREILWEIRTLDWVKAVNTQREARRVILPNIPEGSVVMPLFSRNS